MSTLISFLGKGKADPRTGYRTANYRFDPGFSRNVPFFGMALTDYLKPDRLILVGTAGSMWDVFFEREGADDDAMLELMAAVEAGGVDERMLELPRQQLGEQLGIPVDCLLIPYARDAAEQAAILRRLAEVVQPGESLSIDVTHGFRHLPMLAMVAARYLARVVGVKVEELYYGALEMTAPDGETPVLRLGGLLAMLDWVDALATYHKDGDYGVFAPLLAADGMEKGRADLLKRAAYFERTGNPVRARETLGSVFPSVEAHSGALGGLFAETLKARINWFAGPGATTGNSCSPTPTANGRTTCAPPLSCTKPSSHAPASSGAAMPTTSSKERKPTPPPAAKAARSPNSNTCATASRTVCARATTRTRAPSTTKTNCAPRSRPCANISFHNQDPP
ncbi:MAG: TIGR02221 family CRISPR-associated protein [Candidatus Accumulibacter sp. UW25]|jgi:CRISPR-associated Csx2 family protein